MLTLSPRLGELLTRATQTPDLETALWKVLSEYVDLKVAALTETNQQFEKKWKVSFDEFVRRSHDNTLGKDVYGLEVERDFWEWEQTVTLLQHYKALKP
jgi:hypothetical protein